MRRNDKAEKIKNVSIITALLVLLGIAGLVLFLLNNKEDSNPIQTKIANHDVFFYKQDGSIALFNTKDKKYIHENKVASKTTIDKTESYINVFDLSKNQEYLYASSPFSDEIVTFSQKEKGLEEISRLKVNNTIDNFKILGNNVLVQYINSPTIEIFELKSKELKNTIEFKENVTSIEADDDFIYAGVGNYIEILPIDNLDSTNHVKIHTGAKTISMLKSEDGFLYAANTFATDTGNSVLLKVDLKNNNVENILEVGKEYPIAMFERDSYLYILCQGLTDDILDGISIIDKDNFERFKNVSTGDTPNAMAYTEDGYIYVSHEDGKVAVINATNNFNIDTSFTINGVKNMVIK